MSRAFFLAALAALLLAPAPAPAEGFDFASLEPVSDEELDQQRGGFIWSGMDIRFGAEVRTYLEGELVMQSTVSWTDDGPETTRFVSGALTPVAADQLRAGVAGFGDIAITVGDSQIFLANGGQTLLAHNVEGTIENILINSASNVNIRQEVVATLDVTNYAQFGAEVDAARMASTLDFLRDMATVLSGLGR